VAEDDLAHGRGAAARDAVEDLARERDPEPPWVRPWSHLLRAEMLDLEGDREAALDEYKRALADPHGQEELKARATQGLQRPFSATAVPAPGAL
jgi:hypothetical protein